MTARLDIVNGVKRIEQPSGLSPVVIFKYKASPNLPLTLDDNEGNYNRNSQFCMMFDLSTINSKNLGNLTVQEESNKKCIFHISQHCEIKPMQ